MQADMNVQCYIATSSKRGAALERQAIASLTCTTISRIKVHYGFQTRWLVEVLGEANSLLRVKNTPNPGEMHGILSKDDTHLRRKNVLGSPHLRDNGRRSPSYADPWQYKCTPLKKVISGCVFLPSYKSWSLCFALFTPVLSAEHTQRETLQIHSCRNLRLP